MELSKAKQIVCEAGLKLVKEGLVARTWGNISCRVDDKTFVITPSGRTYDNLTPDDIVIVNIDNSSWKGEIKPSSEKGIHAGVYKIRPEIEAVIHTHQKNASVVAGARREIPLLNDKMKKIIGNSIPCASYGLPGTGKLKKGTVLALEKSGSNATLMANHGALCVGIDMNKAFEVTKLLEEICDLFIKQEFKSISGLKTATENEMQEYYLKQIRRK